MLGRNKFLGRVSRIARIKGFPLTLAQHVKLARFIDDYDEGDRAIVGAANILRRTRSDFDGGDVLALVDFYLVD